MWYVIKHFWFVRFAEWHLRNITSDELFDVIDI